MVPRWSKAPSLFFLSLPFFSVHHDLTEKRVIFSRINHVLGSGNGTTVANSGEISCHRDAKRPLLSSKGSSLIYIPLCLEFGRNANRYEEREIDLSSFRSDATLDTTTKTKILRIRSRCLEKNLKRTVVRVAIPSSTIPRTYPFRTILNPRGLRRIIFRDREELSVSRREPIRFLFPFHLILLLFR